SKNNFPEIREDHPYFFTLSPYAYHWFHLQKVHAEVDDNKNLPMLEVKKWKDVLTSGVLAQLERKVLPEYLNKMRWFGGKAKGIQNIKITDYAEVPIKGNTSFFLLIQVSYESGMPEIYQLPVAFVQGQSAEKTIESYPQSVICRLKVANEEG